jgi:glycosyltransferase involved in cell wall biosynthesis
MNKITFVLPSRNNLEFLQLAYKSLCDLKLKHEILVLDDASTDGTQEWIKSLNDPDLITYHNPGPERIGIVGMFDKGIEMARTEIIFVFHADMVACKDLDKNILKLLKPGTIVSATRVEPPLHPPGPEKITADFGIETDQFSFNKWYDESEKLKQDKTTEGIFAPWCMYKEDYLAIGGHDELFAPQSKEDSDLFNRFVLNGYQVIQSWDALVYHFTSRGSRFNKHAGGDTGKNSEEWLYTTTKNGKEFIRKWGHFVSHDPLMKPIIPPKYNIAYVIKKCHTGDLLTALEPWCDRIYIENQDMVDIYINREQENTSFDLSKRVFIENNNDPIGENDIVVKFDATQLTQQNFQLLQQLPNIIKESGEIGKFELDIFTIEINHLEEYQNNLIKI